MCTCTTDNNHLISPNEKKYRLADFFAFNWDSYKMSPKEFIRPEQYKAVEAMQLCRTDALGVDIYSCKECGAISEVRHNCKNRFCPTCSWSDTVKWGDRVKGQMFSLPHRHVVFTVPHALNGLIKSNDKYLLNILLRTSADTIKDWMSQKYRLRPGIISVLHTFGEQKNSHYHVHMIVSWGGISKVTGKLERIKGDFVNYEFLQKKFRCKFEDSLVSLYNTGELFHQFSTKSLFLQFLRRINDKNWILHLEPPMEVPPQVIRYIGRYSKRACISERKITNIEGEYISFRYKDYKNLDINKKPIERELRLHYSDFFPRLLQHVPLPYFRLVRYYGVYSNRVSVPEEYLYKPSEAEVEANVEKDNPFFCATCHIEKEYQFTEILRWEIGEKDKAVKVRYNKNDNRFRKAA